MHSFGCFISVVCQTTYRYTDTPRFLDTGQGYNVTVHRGQKAELACKVENIGPKEVGVAVNEGGKNPVRIFVVSIYYGFIAVCRSFYFCKIIENPGYLNVLISRNVYNLIMFKVVST